MGWDPKAPLGWEVLRGNEQAQQDEPCTTEALLLAAVVGVDLKSPRSHQAPLGLPQALSVGSQLGKPTATSEAMEAMVAACLGAIACADTAVCG